MKKIIAAFDSLKFSESTRDYAINIAKLTGAHLVGVFMDDAQYTSYKIYDLVVKEGVSEAQFKKFEDKDRVTRATAAANFQKACDSAGIEYSVHHDKKFAARELKHESVYADLLIIDASETLTHYPEKIPTRFIRNLLVEVQCPVLIVPKKYRPVNKVFLLYDGTPSSVYAIKMFSCLLPQLQQFDTETIAVNSFNETLHLPDNKLMKELMRYHFPKAKYVIRKGWAEEEITKYIKEQQENGLIVLGAYQRGAVSRWFRESMADILLKNIKLPLFIAHHK